MTNTTIDVSADVTELTHGTEYIGHISFDGVEFQYHLKCDLPIDRLRSLGEARNIEDKVHFEVTEPDGQPLAEKRAKEVIMVYASMLVNGIYRFQSSGLRNLKPELSELVRMELYQPEIGIAAFGRPAGNKMQTSFQIDKASDIKSCYLETFLESYKK